MIRKIFISMFSFVAFALFASSPAYSQIAIIIKGNPDTGYVILDGELHTLETVIIVGGQPSPNPNPNPSPNPSPNPNPPLPTGSLSGYARDLAKSAAFPRAEVGMVRSNLIRVSEAIEQLKDPTNINLSILTPQDAIAALNGANKESLGTSYDRWRPYLLKVADELDRRVVDGKIKNHVYDVGVAYSEIADGLSAFSDDTRELRPVDFKALLPPTRAPPDDLEAEKRLQAEYGYNGGEVDQLLQAQPAVHLDQPGQPMWARETAAAGQRVFNREFGSNKLPDQFKGEGRGRRAVYWNYALRHDGRDGLKRFGISQITGNCVAASSGDVGITHMLGVAYYLHGRAIKPGEVGSTAHYMFRGHCGQGANLGTLGVALQRYGYPLRIEYLRGKYDLRDTDDDQRFGMNSCRNQPSDFWTECKQYELGKFANFDGNVDDAMDVLYAGGVLWCGGTRTWSSNGNPICSNTRVGAHAQTCIGYDDTDECKRLLGIDEPVFFFDQTWGGGETSYIKSGWREELWGKRTRGMGMLKWSDCWGLLYNATTFAFWPDLSGTSPETMNWRMN